MGLGPLIPFLSHKFGRDENDYAAFLMMGSILSIIGSIIISIISSRISFHQGIIFGYITLGLASICFEFVSNFYIQALLFGFIYFGMGFVAVFSKTGTIEIYHGTTIETAFLIQTSCSVLPGLVAPPLILLVKTEFILLLGLVSILMILPSFLLKSPEISAEITS